MASNDDNNGALSLARYGLCGVLNNVQAPRYLPCGPDNDVDQPAVISVTNADEDRAPTGDQPTISLENNPLFDPSMQERKDEIDALRARVDTILNKMVQNSGDDVAKLRQKIAEMRTGPPPQTPIRAHQHLAKAWGAGMMGCPMSPALTTVSKASVTPSTDTELHTNRTSSKKENNNEQGSLLGPEKSSLDEKDDDETIDNMAFDFGVAPLSMSKSTNLAELGSISEMNSKKTQDPPAFLKASNSMTPSQDPEGDASHCSGDDGKGDDDDDMCDAIAKAESVANKEKKQQHQKKHMPAPTPEIIKVKSSKSKELEIAKSKDQSVKKSKSNDPPASPKPNQAKQQIQAKTQAEVHQEMMGRSKSPPPSVINVTLPSGNSSPDHLGIDGSASESSLSRPPSKEEIVLVEEVTEQRIRDPYGDKGIYTGVLVKRRPHGRGSMRYDDGRHYEGHWNHGRWHGVGRAIFANHDIFEGSYDMDQRHGHGMYQWNDGRVYTGQFFQDQRQGRGTYTWPDGAVYQGEFKAGHRHGQGMYRFADGSVYTG